MVLALNAAAFSQEPDAIYSAWARHHAVLESVRGMFVVEDDQYDKPSLPPDMDFGQSGLLRCLFISRRLYLIQNEGVGRSFRCGAVIFCDTNFVSYCRRFWERGLRGPVEASFRTAIELTLPLAGCMDAFPYMVENFDNPDDEHVRACLKGFLAYKATSLHAFRSHGHFDVTGSEFDLEHAADAELALMRGPDFKRVHSWMKQHYHWARVVLIKAALLTFEHPGHSVDQQMFALLEYLHRELARIPNFEIHVALLYLDRERRARFFDPVSTNAKDLNGKLVAMAWDLAHWRSLFEMLLMRSKDPAWASFPVPYLLSFDRKYVELTELFRIQGLLYCENPLRCEQIYTRAAIEPGSNLLHGQCGEFFTASALRDRQQRQELDEDQLDQRLVAVESTLTAELTSALSKG